MDKIEYFFRQRKLKLKFIEKTQQLGINKENKVNGFINEISMYKVAEYYLGVKRSGRPQYLFFNEKFDLLVNAYSQTGFLNRIEDLLVDKVKVYLIETEVNHFVRKLRLDARLSKKAFANKLGLSQSFVGRIENANLRLRVQILFDILQKLGMSFKDYQKQFKKEVGNFYDYQIHIELKEYIEKKEIDDLISIRDLINHYNMKLGTIYRYAKITEEELKEENYRLVPGKVSLKKFEEIYRRFNNE